MKRIATTLLVAGLMATPMLALPPPAAAGVSVGISIGIAPPPLPVYAQPVAPGSGYLWTPGYWAWDAAYGNYYWVPGTWVIPPTVGLLWTPGWWGWSAGYYRWHPGYWGERVGFYGGINYGFGYFGAGYVGGYWRGHDFYYNRAVNNVNVTNIHNVYVNKTVINHVNVNRVSYNGAHGGVMARPNAEQRATANERRFSGTSMQTHQREVAMRNPAQRFTANRARPAVFATQRAGNFAGPHVVRESAAPRARLENTPERARGTVTAPRRERDFAVTQRPHPQAARTDPATRTERAVAASERGHAAQRGTRQRNEASRDNSPVAHAKHRGKPKHAKQDQGGRR
ncbi:MAG: hypothetical protein ACREPY_06125 [Rhodanobacteraceae bacterium]